MCSEFKPQTVWVEGVARPPCKIAGLIAHGINRNSPWGNAKVHLLNCLHGGFDRMEDFRVDSPWTHSTLREAVKELLGIGAIRSINVRGTGVRAVRYELTEASDANA